MTLSSCLGSKLYGHVTMLKDTGVVVVYTALV